MHSSASINLIKQKENILDQIIGWALTLGRLLIIITEIVAFSTFLVRFSLDRKLIDLHSKILQEQAIVVSLKDKEEAYRNLQDRISVATSVSNSGNKNIEILKDVTALTPPEMNFNSLSIENNKLSIDANLTTIAPLSTFIKSLRESPKVSSVGIDRIGSGTDGGINVQLSATLK